MGEIWGDMGRYGEVCPLECELEHDDLEASSRPRDLGRSGEIWGDVGRSGEMWGDVDPCSASRRRRPSVTSTRSSAASGSAEGKSPPPT